MCEQVASIFGLSIGKVFDEFFKKKHNLLNRWEEGKEDASSVFNHFSKMGKKKCDFSTFCFQCANIFTLNKEMVPLIKELRKRLTQISDLPITKQFIKIKFYDFKQTTAETTSNYLNEQAFFDLLQTGFNRHNKPVRLIGVGVRFSKDH